MLSVLTQFSTDDRYKFYTTPLGRQEFMVVAVDLNSRKEVTFEGCRKECEDFKLLVCSDGF